MIAVLKLFIAVGSIHGAVNDSAARPVAGVEVTLPDLGRRTTTRPDGRYNFAGLPRGDFTLVFRRVGYAPVTRRVQVQDADVELNVTLHPAAVELEPLTVTGTRTAADPLTSPLPTATLDRDGVEARPGVSLAHALADIPGIRALTTGGEIGKPVIRGLSGPRVLVLDDGRRLEDYSWSDEDGPSTDPRFADRVEVIRGPASVLYGSDALGGVVNVISEDVPDGKGPLRTRIEAYGASNNGEMGTSVHMERGSDAVGWLVGVAGRRAEALHTPAGELENTGFNAISGEAAGGTSGTWGKLSGRFTHYGGEFKLLEADTGSLPPPPPPGGVEQGPVRKLSDDRVQFDGTFPAGRLRLETKGQWQRHWLAEVVEGDTAATDKGFDLVLNTLSLDLFAHHGSSQLTGTFGASAFHQTNATRGVEPLVPNARLSGAAAFVFEQATLGGPASRWSALGGLRVDVRRLDADSDADLANAPAQRNYTAVSGDVGLVFRPAATLALAANVGRAWRAPTLFELLTDGPHPGEARFELGDPTLKPETGLNVDLSLRWQSANARGEIAGYRNQISDYIYIQPTGGTQDSLPVYQYVQNNAVLLGGEASVEVAPTAAIGLHARLDYVRGSRQNDHSPLPLMPPLRATIGGEWRVMARSGPDPFALRIGGDVEMVARQTRLDTLDIPTAGYGLLDLFVRVERRLGLHPLRLDVQVRNALDTRYRDFLSRYKAFALNPGRNIVVRLATEL